MKKYILFLFLLLATLAEATQTVVQTVRSDNPCGNTTSCSMTISAIGAGHALVLIQFKGTPVAVATGGTWVFPAAGACDISGFASTPGAPGIGNIACVYNLSSSTSGTTFNWTNQNNTVEGATLYEISFTSSSVAFDGFTSYGQTSFDTAPTRVAATVTGTSDFIIEALLGSNNYCTGVSGSWAGNFPTAGQQRASAVLVNATVGTAPTWTCGNNQYVFMSVSFKESAGGGGSTAAPKHRSGWRG